MRIEIPEFSRCCACIPLRYGIITFGYLNLAFTTLLFSIEIWLIVVFDPQYSVVESLQSFSMFIYHGVGMSTQTWFIFILYTLEIIFNIVLLFGAHRKITKLMRAYYYYGITTSLAAFLCYLVVHKDSDAYRSIEYLVVDLCMALSGLVIHVYLLLLIRSELKKLDMKKQLSFVNHSAEVYFNQL